MSRRLAGVLLGLLAAAAAGGGEDRAAWAVAVFPSGAEFQLEIAAEPEERYRGYMYRESVGPHDGMLFLFGQDDRHGFWMKNCRVRLDIIWLDADSRVVDIAHDLPPCPPEGECPVVRPMRAARRVLEVAGGTARAEGLNPGARIEILSDPPLF